MIIAVGSKNKAKVEAVQQAIRGNGIREHCYSSFLEDKIKPYTINPDVREQPFGPEETMRGAINRALGAFTAGNTKGACRFGIGIEAGLVPVPILTHSNGNIRYEEKTYCVIYDGSNWYFGTSAGFEHPQAVITCVLKEKVDISEAYKRCGFTDSPKIGEEAGCINLLTKGRIQRDHEIADAICRALIAFENPEMYRLR